MKNFRRRLAKLISPDKGKLFFVLKFGGKVYLKATEDELRAQIALSGSNVGVRFRDKALVFECYEIDPNKKETQK